MHKGVKRPREKARGTTAACGSIATGLLGISFYSADWQSMKVGLGEGGGGVLASDVSHSLQRHSSVKDDIGCYREDEGFGKNARERRFCVKEGGILDKKGWRLTLACCDSVAGISSSSYSVPPSANILGMAMAPPGKYGL